MMKSCCICKINQGVFLDVSFHNIPKNDEIKSKWFIIIGREVNMHSVVCSQHFRDEDFYYKEFDDGSKRFLKPTAIPSLIDYGSFSEYVLDENNEEYVDEKPDISMLNIHLKNNTNTTAVNVPNAVHDNFIECKPEIIETDSNDALSYANNLITNRQIKQEESVWEDTEDPLNDNQQTSFSCKNNHRDEPRKIFKQKKCIGLLKRMDFTSDYSYNIVMQYSKKCKREQKSLKQRLRRLDRKVNELKSLLNKKFLTQEDIEIINVKEQE